MIMMTNINNIDLFALLVTSFWINLAFNLAVSLASTAWHFYV